MANDFNQAHNLSTKLSTALSEVIRGQEATIKLVVAALLADGHVLLEDYPGSGKTTLCKTLGHLISRDDFKSVGEHILPFRRIQFTPDMLPGDVLGVNIFEPKNGNFRFVHGPVFAHIVLADELNRTGPKVQAAFIECMAEKQVTIDNVTHKLDDLFFVMGTQNPLDIAGTYPLPIVQLDRFLFKLPLNYVDPKTEVEILKSHKQITAQSESPDSICSRSDILHARTIAESVHINEDMQQAIVEIMQATRGNALIQYGASTRAAIMLQRAVKAWAVVQGREYADEDDLKFIAPFVLNHRLKFHGGAGEPKEALRKLIEPPLERLISKGTARRR